MRISLSVVLMLGLAAAATTRAAAEPVSGSVSSGGGANKIPIGGAAVAVYQVQTSGPREIAAGTADQNGNFSFNAPVVANNGIVYVIARKAPHTEFMTVIGGMDLTGLAVNEMTTVASAYALARFLDNGALPQRQFTYLPLLVAAGMAENLVSAKTGMPSDVIRQPPNAKETNAWYELGTLANMLAPCVRNPNGSICADFLRLSGANTTLGAIWSVARHPTRNVGPLFAVSETTKIYEPYLNASAQGPDAGNALMRLDAFTLAVKFNATGRVENGAEVCPFGGAGNVAFDARGYAWITNNVVQGTPGSSHCQIVLKPNGRPADGAAGTPSSPLTGGGLLGQGFGIGLDPNGHVWSGNFGWGDVDPQKPDGSAGGSVSRFDLSGRPLSGDHGIVDSVNRVQGVVSDSAGNIWIASYGNNCVGFFPKGRAHPDPSTGQDNWPCYVTVNPATNQPYAGTFDVRIDSQGAGWVSYTGSSVVSKFVVQGEQLAHQFTRPAGDNAHAKGMAIDTQDNVWIASGGEDAVYAYDSSGAPLAGQPFKGGGILAPWGIGIDSDDMIWVANFAHPVQKDVKYHVSQLCGVNLAKCPPGLKTGDPITADTGYTLPSGGDEVRLHDGKPLYYPYTEKSYKPMMRTTSCQPDMAGNLWCMNNWKPDAANDVTSNPGGDGVIVFIGLAAPVKPESYSAPPTSPF